MKALIGRGACAALGAHAGVARRPAEKLEERAADAAIGNADGALIGGHHRVRLGDGAGVLLAGAGDLVDGIDEDFGIERPSGMYGGNDLSAQLREERRFQIVDNLTLRRGNHTLKTGYDITRSKTRVEARFNPVGNFLYETDAPFEPGDCGDLIAFQIDGYCSADAGTECRRDADCHGDGKGYCVLPTVPCPGVPDVDDEVLVVFTNGDPRFPLVLGGLWNGASPAPADLQPEGNRFKRIRSKNGITITLDDQQGQETLTLETIWLHGVNDGDGLVRPRVEYALRDDLQIWLGADVFYGPRRGLFGEFDSDDRILLGFEWGI